MAASLQVMDIVLYEGGTDGIKEFWASYNSLIDCLESGAVSKTFIGVDIWNKLMDSRQCKSCRHEVKLPYVYTRGLNTFTASLVIVTQHGRLAYEMVEDMRHISIIRPKDKALHIKMTLENMQPMQKVLNIEQGWLPQRFTEIIQAIL
jgi:hypothetical protein